MKPILFIRCNDGVPTPKHHEKIKHEAKERFGKDYNILLTFGNDDKRPHTEAEVLNAEQLTEEKLEELKELFNK